MLPFVARLFFIIEFVNGGDLMFHMQRQRRLPEEHARFYSAEICLALNFLHDKGLSGSMSLYLCNCSFRFIKLIINWNLSGVVLYLLTYSVVPEWCICGLDLMGRDSVGHDLNWWADSMGHDLWLMGRFHGSWHLTDGQIPWVMTLTDGQIPWVLTFHLLFTRTCFIPWIQIFRFDFHDECSRWLI